MNKKQYVKPEQRVVKLQHKCHILTGSNRMTVSRAITNDDIGIDYGGSDESYDDYDVYGAR